jgi:hypothetical protein
MRVISVGVSRVFRIVELDDGRLRIEQAVKALKKWDWKPLALVDGLGRWGEAHGAMHQMQADFGDRMLHAQAQAKRMEKAL